MDYSYIGYHTKEGEDTASLSLTINTGDADAQRIIVCALRFSYEGDSLSIKIGGTEANVDGAYQPLSSRPLFLVSAPIPTGTTATLEITATGEEAEVRTTEVQVYRLIGPIQVFDSKNAGSSSLSINENVSGVTIAVCNLQTAGNPSLSWDYPSQDDNRITDFFHRWSVASAATESIGSNTVIVSGSGSIITVYSLLAVNYSSYNPVDAVLDTQLDPLVTLATNAPVEGIINTALDPLESDSYAEYGVTGTSAIALDDLVADGYSEIGSAVDQFIRSALSRDIQDVFIILMRITHELLDEPIRLCLNTPGHGVWSNGYYYEATYFDLILVSDNERHPTARLRIPNADQEIGQIINSIETPVSIRFDIVLAANPNKIEKSYRNFELRRVSWDAQQVEGELVHTDLSNLPWPAMRTTPALFPALFS